MYGQRRKKMNLLAYLIYLAVTYLITVNVGLSFYRNGRLYMLALFKGDEKLSDTLNRLLLVGYYLLNLGYAAVMIRFWKKVVSWPELLASLCTMTGTIMLSLAVIHFCNMAVILFLSKRNFHF